MEVRGGFSLLARPERRVFLGAFDSGPLAAVRVSCYHPGVISEELLAVLACPKCKQKVELSDDKSALICEADRLRYPIVDDIPVMLIEEAETF